MIRLESQIRLERGFSGRRENADIALGVVVAAADAERRAFVEPFLMMFMAPEVAKSPRCGK